MKKIRLDFQECSAQEFEGRPLVIPAHNGGFDSSLDGTSATASLEDAAQNNAVLQQLTDFRASLPLPNCIGKAKLFSEVPD